jgi:cytoskeletal protein CcmA (bactofilin family)
MENKIVNIGQSIHIKGELTGNEDLTIEGKVEGKVFLKDHNLTIGANGKIVAEIQAKTVMILGEVTGNINADDKVEVAATGSMRGDIHAPRVVLADGGKFKGSIDMDKKPGSSAAVSASTSASASAPATPSAGRPAMEPVGAGAPSKGANL